MKSLFLSIVLYLFLHTAFCQSISKENLCKKWELKKYEINLSDFAPNKKEKHDYILLKQDMKYESVTEGKKETGKWMLNVNGKYVILYNNKGIGLKLFIKEISRNKLVLANIMEMEYIKMHFINTT